MNSKELGFVLVFVAAFGLSNYFVKEMKFKRTSLVFYNIFVGSLGLGLMYNVFKAAPKSEVFLGRI